MFWHDLRHAARALRKNWIFTLPAIFSLAVGIGANTTIFTFLHAIFLNPLPVEAPARLVSISGQRADEPARRDLSYPDYLDYREQTRVFSGLAASRWLSLALRTDEGPHWLFGELVTANYFDVLGVRAAVGRTFSDAETRPASRPAAVLSYGLWQRLFAGDPDVVGRELEINRTAFTVVGVAARGFQGLNLLQSPDLWLPLATREQVLEADEAARFERRDAELLRVFGRLAPGVGPRQAAAAVEVLAENLARQHPVANRELGAVVEPVVRSVLPDETRSGLLRGGGLLAAAMGLLLVIACANVANLLLARSFARRREIALRAALGAGRGPLLRQLLTEGLLLAVLGGVAALAIAAVGGRLLWALRPSYLPDTLDPSLDLQVLGFNLVLSLLVGVVFSLAPAIQALRLELAPELQDRGAGAAARDRRGMRVWSALVVVQIALAMTVLVGAGLFLRSFDNLRRIDPGFESENLFLVPVAVGPQGYGEAEGLALYRRLVERVRLLENVETAAVSSRPVLAPGSPRIAIETRDARGEEPGAEKTIPYGTVGPGYFETMALVLLDGRSFTAQDRDDAPRRVVVNRAAARWLWPERSAVGRRLWVEGAPHEVIGVVENAKYDRLSEPPQPYLYFAVEQRYSPVVILHVRTRTAPQPIAALVRDEIRGLDPGLPLLETRFVQQLIDFSLWAPRTIAGLLTIFGVFALVLSAVGIYGLVAYTSRLRDREIGIRMAMGARRRDVWRLVLRQGMGRVAVGIGAGLLLAAAASRWLASLLYGVSPFDPATLAAIALVLASVAMLAIFFPARRAATLDPMRVLREE